MRYGRYIGLIAASIAGGLAIMTRISLAPAQERPATASDATRPSYPMAPGAQPVKLADGFKWTEGACCDAKGNIFFVDQPTDRILEWSVDQKLSTFMHPSGHSNGMCFDSAGNLISCADEKNELWSIAPDGSHTVLVKDYKGKLLNGPNDVWIRPDGGMYLTDPLFARDWWKGFRDNKSQLDCDGVYFFSPDHKSLTLVIDDMKKPNGIIGTPDGKTLYVSDWAGGPTNSYTINPDGSLSDKKQFCSVGSDGMTIDSDGNIYTTVGRTMQIFDKNGTRLQSLRFPANTANCCFGGADRQMLFICTANAVWGVQMTTHGVGSQ